MPKLAAHRSAANTKGPAAARGRRDDSLTLLPGCGEAEYDHAPEPILLLGWLAASWSLWALLVSGVDARGESLLCGDGFE
jgi:hypothetical protein